MQTPTDSNFSFYRFNEAPGQTFTPYRDRDQHSERGRHNNKAEQSCDHTRLDREGKRTDLAWRSPQSRSFAWEPPETLGLGSGLGALLENKCGHVRQVVGVVVVVVVLGLVGVAGWVPVD